MYFSILDVMKLWRKISKPELFSELIKKLTSHEEELVMLRKELQSKSKLIETLSKQIAPTPKK